MATVFAPCGAITGVERPGSFAFLGIPYAEAPVGKLRYAAPVRRARFADVFDATSFGATPQRRKFFDDTFIPEPSMPGDDMLNLNVYTPTLNSNAHLPVLVYIHGGGYSTGCHNGHWFDGAPFNRNDVVVVVISYRLGFHGFGWIEDAPRNRGMLDMIAALEWIRENISDFGGNPDRVTICGQSAGGGAVLALMCMPSAQGLFHGVISQSPVIGAVTAAQDEERGRNLAAACGVAPTTTGWSALNDDEILDKQFELAEFGEPIHPVGKMVRWIEDAPCEVRLSWGPAIDPETLPVTPYEALAVSKIPLLIGATLDEFMVPGAYNADEIRHWADGINLSIAHRQYLEAAIADGSPDPIGRLSTAVMFREGNLKIAAIRPKGTTWLYDFVHRNQGTQAADHCTDLPFIWDCLGDSHAQKFMGSNEPQALATAMHGVWVTFIKQLHPGWTAGGCRIFGDPKGRRGYEDVAALVQALPPTV